MRHVTALLLILTTTTFSVMPATAAYLCSYTARISPSDKVNSKGVSIAKGYTNATVAGILRQDRANLYEFNKGDYEDSGDCLFSSKAARANMQKSITAGNIPQYAKKIIVDGNPLINVDVYSSHIEVDILESNYNRSQSRIR
ncbi:MULTISPECIES: hypothetical protein [Psychrobacter]|uniref:hypothetical protein n=1 Tax=Psychrobacter TaxID=497 RepID=UPI00146D1998|nr:MULTISPECIES: hypothetical protein [Psychrobacter]